MSREFFNNKAEEWDKIVNHDCTKIKKVISELPDLDSPTILDVGSGTGIMIPFLHEKFGDVAQINAIDFAEKMIQVSQRKHEHYENVKFVVGDVYTYPFYDEKFDLIVCYSVFPHFYDKGKILARFRELLKKDGMLVIFHSQSREAINNLHKKAGEEVKEDRLPPADQVAELASNMGYIIKGIVDDNQMYLLKLSIILPWKKDT
ncbi:MAG: class I SAM-dependent methyltransferase [Halanaerobiales bacterium]|nr:class I SAM-dependent methyltransferase [Halanaerobiales bacterium]